MIDENINKIRSDIPDYVELIAISKTKPNEDIMKAYNNGHRYVSYTHLTLPTKRIV